MMRNVSVILCMSLALMTGCKKSNPDETAKVTYTVTHPQITDTSINSDYVATIKSQRNIEVRSQVEGILRQVYVDEGQHVRAGQPLFAMASERFRAESEKAGADLEQARIDYNNTSLLANNKVVARSQQQQARAKMRSAAADLQLAKLQLRYATIRAPFDGVVGMLPKKAGTLLNEGDLLTTLSDNRAVYAYFNLSESEYLDYADKGQKLENLPVNLIMANGRNYPIGGKVTAVAGEFDAESGTIALRARFDNPNGLLRNGETGKVRIVRTLHNAMIIPQSATYEIQDQRYVFVVDNNHVAHQRLITVANELPGVYVVSNGLSANENYLVSGVQKVKDGDKVQTRYQAPEAVIKSLTLKAN